MWDVDMSHAAVTCADMVCSLAPAPIPACAWSKQVHSSSWNDRYNPPLKMTVTKASPCTCNSSQGSPILLIKCVVQICLLWARQAYPQTNLHANHYLKCLGEAIQKWDVFMTKIWGQAQRCWLMKVTSGYVSEPIMFILDWQGLIRLTY